MDIIVKWGELRDWKSALLAVMPQRKFAEGPKVAIPPPETPPSLDVEQEE